MDTIKYFGPPGTGKTTTLISTLKHVLSSGVPLSRVAYLTHTTAAADEVKKRLSDEGFDLKQARWFRTIHSACCAKVGVRRPDILSTRHYDDFSDVSGFRATGSLEVEELASFDIADLDNSFDICLHARSYASNRMISLDEAIDALPSHPSLSDIGPFLDAFERYKRSKGLIDFVDMLDLYTETDEWGPLEVDVVIVDEAQDLSRRQWRAIQLFSRSARTLYLAGDDDQAIYTFIGADEFGFLDHRSDKDIVLDLSYRCPVAIGSVADRVIRGVSRRREKAVRWSDRGGAMIAAPADPEALPWLDWLEAGKSVIALVRHRRQAQKLRRTLHELGVPHSLKGHSIQTSEAAGIVRLYLGLTMLGEQVRPLQAARLVSWLGKSSTRLKALGKDDRSLLVGREDISEIEEVRDWPKYLAQSRVQRRELEVLRDMLNEYGLDIIGKAPLIDVSTYHASKGREADVVVCFPDCYGAVWSEQNRNLDGEIRLSYVGLTRARETVFIAQPQTATYMRPLVEGL